jgi:hypothetical protein
MGDGKIESGLGPCDQCRLGCSGGGGGAGCRKSWSAFSVGRAVFLVRSIF